MGALVAGAGAAAGAYAGSLLGGNSAKKAARDRKAIELAFNRTGKDATYYTAKLISQSEQDIIEARNVVRQAIDSTRSDITNVFQQGFTELKDAQQNIDTDVEGVNLNSLDAFFNTLGILTDKDLAEGLTSEQVSQRAFETFQTSTQQKLLDEQLQRETTDLQKQFSAQGLLNSGSFANALLDRGRSLANQYFGDYQQNLFQGGQLALQNAQANADRQANLQSNLLGIGANLRSNYASNLVNLTGQQVGAESTFGADLADLDLARAANIQNYATRTQQQIRELGNTKLGTGAQYKAARALEFDARGAYNNLFNV